MRTGLLGYPSRLPSSTPPSWSMFIPKRPRIIATCGRLIDVRASTSCAVHLAHVTGERATYAPLSREIPHPPTVLRLEIAIARSTWTLLSSIISHPRADLASTTHTSSPGAQALDLPLITSTEMLPPHRRRRALSLQRSNHRSAPSLQSVRPEKHAPPYQAGGVGREIVVRIVMLTE